MTGVAEPLISTNPREAQAHYEKMEPLWNRLRPKEEEDIKAKEDELRADWAKLRHRTRKTEGRHDESLQGEVDGQVDG
jgi:hypothetical protein